MGASRRIEVLSPEEGAWVPSREEHPVCTMGLSLGTFEIGGH